MQMENCGILSSSRGVGVRSPVSIMASRGLSSMVSGRSTRPRQRADSHAAKINSVAFSAFAAPPSSGSSPASRQRTFSAIARSTNAQSCRPSSVTTVSQSLSPARRRRLDTAVSEVLEVMAILQFHHNSLYRPVVNRRADRRVDFLDVPVLRALAAERVDHGPAEFRMDVIDAREYCPTCWRPHPGSSPK